MKGLTLEQNTNIINFVQKHHKFAFVNTENTIVVNDKPYCLCIKYVDFCYDSRTQDIWAISFRGLGVDLTFATNSLVSNNSKIPYDSLYDWVMAYLKGEWNDLEILKLLKYEKN